MFLYFFSVPDPEKCKCGIEYRMIEGKFKKWDHHSFNRIIGGKEITTVTFTHCLFEMVQWYINDKNYY